MTPTSAPRFSNGSTYWIVVALAPRRRVRSRPDLQQQLDVVQRQRAERGRGSCVNTTTSQWPSAGAVGTSAAADRARRCRRARESGCRTPRRPSSPAGTRSDSPGRRVARERVVLRRRQERAVLAVRGVGDPFAAQRMPAQVRAGVAAARANGLGACSVGVDRLARVQRQARARRACVSMQRCMRSRRPGDVGARGAGRDGARCARAESSACGRQ